MPPAKFPRGFPRRGEIYLVDFNPSRGSEQAGTRPAVVVSTDAINGPSPTVIVAAMTTTIPKKKYPQNVHLPPGVPLPLEGTILGAQLLTIAKDRLIKYRGVLTAPQVVELNTALKKALALP